MVETPLEMFKGLLRDASVKRTLVVVMGSVTTQFVMSAYPGNPIFYFIPVQAYSLFYWADIPGRCPRSLFPGTPPPASCSYGGFYGAFAWKEAAGKWKDIAGQWKALAG